MRVEYRGVTGEPGVSSFADYLEIREQCPAFSGLVAESRRGGMLVVDGKAELVPLTVVSENYFSVLGVEPISGRTFQADSDRTPEDAPALIISHELWQRRFGADPAIVGRAIRVFDGTYTVVGVMPPVSGGSIV